MKSNTHAKIIKLAITEILLQVGFEATTEQTLNILSDIWIYYTEQMIKKLPPFIQSGKDEQIKLLLLGVVSDEEFQKYEISQFLDQQASIVKHLKEKMEDDCNPNLLSLLKILPKEVNLKSSFRNAKKITLEEKALPSVYEEITVDTFMTEFIDQNLKEKTKCTEECREEMAVNLSPEVKILDDFEKIGNIRINKEEEDVRETRHIEQIGFIDIVGIKETRKVFKL